VIKIDATKRKTTTSSVVKDRYNKKNYKEYKLRVRRDSELIEKLTHFQEGDFQSLNSLVIALLENYFKNKSKSF